MTLPVPTITLFLDLPFSGGDFFTLNDPVKGLLDSATYLLAGDVGTDVTSYGFDINIQRGRTSELDQTGPGTGSLTFRNHDRDLDPLNTSGPFFGFLKPGPRCEIEIYGQRIFTSFVDDWFLEYTVTGDASASVPLTDGLGLMARQSFDAWTTTAGQLAGARLHDILNRPEVSWPGGARDIDTGVATLQGDNVSWSSQPLNYEQLVALSDGGVVHVDRNGVFVFRDRHNLVNPTPIVTFADDGSGIGFHGAAFDGGGVRFFNRVSIDRLSGTLQTVTDPDLGAADAIRALDRSELLMDSDEQSLQMAHYLLSLYKQPVTRVSQIVIKVHTLDPTDQALVASLDLQDVVHVGPWTPQGLGSTIDADMSIEGIQHAITLEEHLLFLSLAPIAQSLAFTLDDATLGKLDGVALLAY